MKTIENLYFNLQQTAQSGQCFRMAKIPDSSSWSVISCGHYLSISQDGCRFTLDCPDADVPFWIRYFDLETDYGAFIASIKSRDTYLRDAAEAGRGIRILRQDPWEMIITFVISQQKTIPKIREAVEALSKNYGEKKTAILADGTCQIYHAFPSPTQLSRASLQDLQDLKLGYRAKYIHRICQDACCGKLNLETLPSLSYEEALARLTDCYGIGAKVANCVCLFGLHHIDAFPVDTWIRQILLKHYYPRNPKKYRPLPEPRRLEALIHDYFGPYKGCAGVMQQYIFYYERTVIHKRE